MTEDEVKAIFLLAGIQLYSQVPVDNGYGRTSELWNGPWWQCRTRIGPVVIGWRKRVIAISWSMFDVPAEEPITPDNVTQGPDHIHAYSPGKAVDYLRALHIAFKCAEQANNLKESAS